MSNPDASHDELLGCTPRMRRWVIGMEAEIERLRSVVNSALGYKASMLETISSRPREEQDIVMQGRLILRAEFISACEQYEAAEAAGEE